MKDLLELQRWLDVLVTAVLGGHMHFKLAAKSALEAVLNAPREPGDVWMAELLAIYTDDILNGKAEGVAKEASAVDSELDAMIALLVCLNEKDRFVQKHTANVRMREHAR